MTLVWRPGYQFDDDAATYIQAVEAVDGQELETAVRRAINSFVVGCKLDGNWSAIKASCILACARTLNGALVPLAGTAPTNFNFVAGDYNRKTGLVANGSTKYLNSNRLGNADPQNNSHCAVYVHTADSTGQNIAYAGDEGSVTGATNIGLSSSSQLFFRCRSAAFANFPSSATGLIGVSRNSASAYNYVVNGSVLRAGTASDGVSTLNAFIFARNQSGVPFFFSNGRISFYSIGESLSLTALSFRVTTLINAIGVAIP